MPGETSRQKAEAAEKLTYARVADAADTLTERGDTPSVRAVQAYLGSGNNGAISAHLAHWRDERAAEPGGNFDIERTLSAAQSAFEDLTEANKRLRQSRDELQEEVVRLTAELAKSDAAVAARNELLELSSVRDARDRISGHSERVRELEQTLERLEKRRKRDRKRLTADVEERWTRWQERLRETLLSEDAAPLSGAEFREKLVRELSQAPTKH